jgi:hypothetical protein
LILGSALEASCLIQKDPGREGSIPPPPPQPDAGDPNVQCMNESAECFQLCGSPECALANNTIPPVLDIPVIWYQPSGAVNNTGTAGPATSTADPCAAINAASLVIRQRACGACHGPQGIAATHFLYVLDDMMLANHPDNTQDGKIMVKPGDPLGSYVYQRIVTGLAGPGSGGMPPAPSTLPGYLGASAVQANPNIVTYPTAADVTVLYAWILNCMPGADKGAYQANYGSGAFGSNPTSGAAAH